VIVELEDHEISEAARLIASDGFIVEGAAATAIAALGKLPLKTKDNVCCILTGTGLKYPSSVKELLQGFRNPHAKYPLQE
jgi:threonine synthase